MRSLARCYRIYGPDLQWGRLGRVGDRSANSRQHRVEMPVAFPIEALLMSAESRHSAFNFVANGVPSNS